MLRAPRRYSYRILATAVLALAAFNLSFRLPHEALLEWDESLYATSALEMIERGHWIATTFGGAIDYYNSKPPLNVWLIAATFDAFGVGLVTLRLASVLAAWTTVAVLMAWTRRLFDESTALLSGLVLSTTFAFVHVHAGRAAGTDALFALLILLTVVVLWAADRRPIHAAWIGPIAAATFLLRGMAVLLPLAIVAAVELRQPRAALARWRPLLAGAVAGIVPVAIWAVLRWQIDGNRFFVAMVGTDFLARTSSVLDGHDGGPFYYLNILQKHHYDWLVAALAAAAVAPPTAAQRAVIRRFWDGQNRTATVLAVWAAVTVLVPSVMRTKLPWYLTPFYPAFALAVGWLCARGLAREEAVRWPRRALTVLVTVAFVTAESKLVWYSYQYRDIGRTAQRLLLAERGQLQGRRIYRDRWDNADAFVVRGMLRAEPALAGGVDAFVNDCGRDDYLLARTGLRDQRLITVRADGDRALYRTR